MVAVTETTSGPPGSTSGMNGSVAGAHVYADDGVYIVTVTVKDDDGGQGSSQLQVTVNNVLPTIVAGPHVRTFEGVQASLPPSKFHDQGTLDTHRAQVNWGDGTIEAAVVTESPFGPPGSTSGLNGTIAGKHTWLNTGIYTVQVCVADDDMPSGSWVCDSFTVDVLNGFMRFVVFGLGDHCKNDQGDGDGDGQGNDDPGQDGDGCIGTTAIVDGDVNIDALAIIGGATGAHHDVEIDENVSVQGDLLSIFDDVRLGDHSRGTGDLFSGEMCSLEDGASIGGSVQSRGDVQLEQNASVTGDITAAGHVTLASGATVGGVIKQLTPVAPYANFSLVAFTVTPGTQEVHVVNGGMLSLTPGSYDDVELEHGSTLALSSGRYFLEGIDADEGSTIRFDLTNGAVVVDVRDAVKIGQGATMVITSAKGRPDDILFRVQGKSVKLDEGGAYLGTWLAPTGSLDLGANSTISGALWGHEVRVGSACKVTPAMAYDQAVLLFLQTH
jgi:hypothetical protein